jgi:hypothetical protein
MNDPRTPDPEAAHRHGANLLPIPLVSTVHHPIEFDELHWDYPHEAYNAFVRDSWERLLDSVTTVFASEFQRARYTKKSELICNGIPLAFLRATTVNSVRSRRTATINPPPLSGSRQPCARFGRRSVSLLSDVQASSGNVATTVCQARVDPRAQQLVRKPRAV